MPTTDKVKIAVTTTGANGAASGSAASIPVSGQVRAVHLDYHGAPATTDVVIQELDHPNKMVLSLADTSTDGWYYPVEATFHHTSNGSSVGSAANAVPKAPIVHGALAMAVLQANALAPAVTATIYLHD